MKSIEQRIKLKEHKEQYNFNIKGEEVQTLKHNNWKQANHKNKKTNK